MRFDLTKKLNLPPISSAASGTLYQQVVEGVKREIAEGRLPPGAALPSFRALAEDLLVSVITVKRAYEELERGGIIYRKQGLGTFVTDRGDEAARDAKRRAALARLQESMAECAELDVPLSDVLAEAQRAFPGKL